MNNGEIRIGYIHACIAGDYRYSSALTVFVNGDKARVVLSENSAIGGMDGPGVAHPYEDRNTSECAAKPGEIVNAIKGIINRELGSTIKRYGKPSKNFVWAGTKERGLSVAKCAKALAIASSK